MSFVRLAWIKRSLSLSRLLVASSRIRILGSASTARADGDSLTLPAAELHAPFSDDRLVAMRKPVDEFVGIGNLGGTSDLIVGGVALAVPDVRWQGFRRTEKRPARRCRSVVGNSPNRFHARSRPSRSMLPLVDRRTWQSDYRASSSQHHSSHNAIVSPGSTSSRNSSRANSIGSGIAERNAVERDPTGELLRTESSRRFCRLHLARLFEKIQDAIEAG